MKNNTQSLLSVEIIFANCVHHMGMACIANDICYLEKEVTQLIKSVDLNTISVDKMQQLKNVSLEAAMEGHVECLKCLLSMHIPIDELCPIIAGYHGHKGVIEFCAKNGIDCSEAWNQYFNAVILYTSQPNDCTNDSVDLTTAAEWVAQYKKSISIR